jgi:hypothetical protein
VGRYKLSCEKLDAIAQVSERVSIIPVLLLHACFSTRASRPFADRACFFFLITGESDMSIADIICSRKWSSKGASSNTDTAKNKYYPSYPMVFTAKKHPFAIPSANLTYTDSENPGNRLPITTTPIDMTCITLQINPAPAPDGSYDFEYAKNLMAATFYEYGDYLVSGPILARKAMIAPQQHSKHGKDDGKDGEHGKKPGKDDEHDNEPTLLPPLYVTHIINAFPNKGKYAMFMRSYWSDGTLGGYWCCE